MSKCKQCGCKKSWAQAAGSTSVDRGNHGQTQATGGTSNPIRNKLDELQGVLKPLTQSPPESSTLDGSAKGEVGEEIRQLEKAIVSLPEGSSYDGTREQLRGNIAALKMKISRSKPLGAQLDSCKAAMARAQKRMQDANEVIQKASVARDEAEKEHQRLAAEMTALELQMPSAQPLQEPKDSIAGLNHALAKMLEELKTSSYVDSEDVKRAEALTQQLTVGLAQIAQMAAAQAVSIPNGSERAEMSVDQAQVAGVTQTAMESELDTPANAKAKAKLAHRKGTFFHPADMRTNR